MQQLNAQKKTKFWLMLLIALLPACGTLQLQPGAACPSLPEMPALKQPIPDSPYSTSAKQNMDDWLLLLTDTSLTSKP